MSKERQRDKTQEWCLFPRHARSVAKIARGAASLLTPDIFIQDYTHPSKGTYHHLLCTHGAMLPIFASVSFKAVVIVVIIYYYSGSEKIVSTDGIGALQRACWDSWTRHVTLRILGLTNHAHTHVYSQCIHIYFWDLLSLWLILVKFLWNLFSKVCRFIKRPSALHAVLYFVLAKCRPFYHPVFWGDPPPPQGAGPQLSDTRWLSALRWPLTFGFRGGVSRRLGEFIISCVSYFVFLWVVLQGAGEMICMYVHVWCLVSLQLKWMMG